MLSAFPLSRGSNPSDGCQCRSSKDLLLSLYFCFHHPQSLSLTSLHALNCRLHLGLCRLLIQSVLLSFDALVSPPTRFQTPVSGFSLRSSCTCAGVSPEPPELVHLVSVQHEPERFSVRFSLYRVRLYVCAAPLNLNVQCRRQVCF